MRPMSTNAGFRRVAPRRRRRALMLILVLWITAVMSILAYSTIYQMTLETRLVTTRKKTLQAKALARAGVAKAFVDLRNDMIFDRSRDDIPPFDALGDVWFYRERDLDDYQLDGSGGTFTVEVIDEQSRFNVNQFNAAKRILLEKIIEYIGYNEEDARIVASAIIDYADPDEEAVLDSSPGNEGFSYGLIRAEAEGLSRRPEDVERVKFPNEPYLTVEALLDVYGVTPELYFGPGTPEAEFYRAKLGPLLGDRFKIEERRLRRRSEDEIVGLRDFFTVYGNTNTNINTAPAHVLSAWISAAQGGIDADRLAERIIRYRPGGSGSGRRDNDTAFKSGADLSANADLAGLSGPMQALNSVGFGSEFFTVRSTGRVDRVTQTLEVIVKREYHQFTLDESFEQVDRAREREQRYEDRRKRWRDQNARDTLHHAMIRIIQWNGS